MEAAPALLAPLEGVHGKSCGNVEGAMGRTNGYLASVAAALSAPVATPHDEAVLGSWDAGAARLLDAMASGGRSRCTPFDVIDF